MHRRSSFGRATCPSSAYALARAVLARTAHARAAAHATRERSRYRLRKTRSRYVHPRIRIAHEILRAFGGGVVAPSANRFGSVSATRAEHVMSDLGDAVDLIVDGGPATIGIESTIVDLAHGAPAILRPGGVTREALSDALGAPVREGGERGARSGKSSFTLRAAGTRRACRKRQRCQRARERATRARLARQSDRLE